MSRGRLFLICVLAILSAAYLGKGLYVGIFASSGRFPGAIDLHSRWIEARYIFRGENPYLIGAGKVDPAVGPPSAVDYPPWTYISALPLLWPSWPAVRIWYAACNVAALLFIGWCLLGRGLDRSSLEGRLLLLFSITAISALGTTLGNGNFGVIVIALLFGAWVANDAGYAITTGLLLGLAMLKPNMAAPFLLVPLVQGKFRTLLVAAAYLVFASLIVWVLTRTDPLEMLVQMFHAAKKFTSVDQGPLNAALRLGLPYEYAVPVTAVFFACLFSVPIWLRRNGETLLLFAFAGVMARLWTYNSNYSNMLVGFLLLALGSFALGSKRFAVPAFLIVGASLWTPASLMATRIPQLSEAAIWIAGVLCLFVFSRPSAALVGEESPDPR